MRQAETVMRSQTRTPRSGPGHLAGRRRIAGESGRAGDGAYSTAGAEVGLAGHPDTDADTVIQLPADDDALQVGGKPEILSSDDPHDSADVEQPADSGSDQTDPAAVATVVRRRPRLVVSALALCLVAVLAACVLVGLATRRDRANVAGGNAALAAARASATAILSYDYRHLDADFARAAAQTTGSFRTDYQATTGDAVAKLATQTQAVVVAQVMAGGIVSSTSERATVLLFVNQTTTSNRLDAAKVDRNRVELTMEKVGSHWLVSGLKAR
jgi:Mce-associated membrane protein